MAIEKFPGNDEIFTFQRFSPRIDLDDILSEVCCRSRVYFKQLKEQRCGVRNFDKADQKRLDRSKFRVSTDNETSCLNIFITVFWNSSDAFRCRNFHRN